jgi:hypothetical protein
MFKYASKVLLLNHAATEVSVMEPRKKIAAAKGSLVQALGHCLAKSTS